MAAEGAVSTTVGLNHNNEDCNGVCVSGSTGNKYSCVTGKEVQLRSREGGGEQGSGTPHANIEEYTTVHGTRLCR